MDVVLASSRGFDLEELLPAGTRLEPVNGGKLKQLTARAKSMLPLGCKYASRPHVYFVCGIPDISELAKSPNQQLYFYREAIYVESPSETFETVKKLLDNAQRCIIERGALPIFSTIPQYNIEIYNNHMLTDKRPKTAHLHHTQADYKIMQQNLSEAIDTLNGYISTINKKVGASTPFLHDTIKESRSRKGRRYYAYRWESRTGFTLIKS